MTVFRPLHARTISNLSCNCGLAFFQLLADNWIGVYSCNVDNYDAMNARYLAVHANLCELRAPTHIPYAILEERVRERAMKLRYLQSPVGSNKTISCPPAAACPSASLGAAALLAFASRTWWRVLRLSPLFATGEEGGGRPKRTVLSLVLRSVRPAPPSDIPSS